MKTLNKIKFTNIICILFLATICLPLNSTAQRFGHGGGGFRGGGGHIGGRTINGGGRNIGNHVFRAPAGRSEGRFRGGIRNEGVFHHGYGFHPYFYHPYHPYFWGPFWHPFGFFCPMLTADAFMFYLSGQPYYYDYGVYYIPSGSGYIAVAPPIGAVVNYLPSGYLTVPVDDAIYYYYAGAFYISQGGSFRVVSAPYGAIVTQIPDGATEEFINGENYLLYNHTYYQPISLNGQDAYEVVQVR